MQFEHGVTRIDQVRSVHLDFAVVLGTGERYTEGQDEEGKYDLSAIHRGESYQLWNEVRIAKRLKFINVHRGNTPTCAPVNPDNPILIPSISLHHNDLPTSLTHVKELWYPATAAGS